MVGESMVRLELEEGERQVVLMALAALSIERPGWDHMLNEIARRIDNDEGGRAKLYDGFRELRKPKEGECCTLVCAAPATHVVHWPGAGRKVMCAKCCERARALAHHMSFNLETERL